MAAGQEVADELVGKPVMAHLVRCGLLCLRESVFGCAVLSGVRMTPRDIDQESGGAFRELRRHSYRV